jgi:hypothetical protein
VRRRRSEVTEMYALIEISNQLLVFFTLRSTAAKHGVRR